MQPVDPFEEIIVEKLKKLLGHVLEVDFESLAELSSLLQSKGDYNCALVARKINDPLASLLQVLNAKKFGRCELYKIYTNLIKERNLQELETNLVLIFNGYFKEPCVLFPDTLNLIPIREPYIRVLEFYITSLKDFARALFAEKT